MELYYYKTKLGNFGDDLNQWLWHALLPNSWDPTDNIIMTGIGTIIGEPLPHNRHKIIFSSGIGYQPRPVSFGAKDWHVVCVRGPLTARVLGLPPTAAVTDGAILLALLPEGQCIPETERQGIVFMPHHEALNVGHWQTICDRAGIEFIDPRGDNKMIIDRLRHARLVLADAMHAAIVADTVRVPWIPLVTSPAINSFKWQDWCQAMELHYSPIRLPPSTFAEQLSSRFMKFFSLTHENISVPLDHVLIDYQKTTRRMTSLQARLLRKLLSICLVLANLITGLPLVRSYLCRYNAHQTELAALALREAVKAKPMLSSNEVFQARLQEMSHRLNQIERIAAQARQQ
jgi:succinoglycan biosynthesis protein ExoV